jgi:5-formyltetrahydrofolate cyclo-ligase
MDQAITKHDLRKALRQARREHVSAQPDAIRALLFHRPPAPLMTQIGHEAIIGLYSATEFEAPASGYARFFQEAGHSIALPHFASDDDPMSFRAHTDPYGEADLEIGPFRIRQPASDAPLIQPDVVFVPLMGFTAELERLGQGGGHYDRWLADHPDTLAIGLAWDAQQVETLPTEPHDIALDAVVTPTRLYGLK